MKCKHCDIEYIGETGNTIICRLAQHKYNIINHKETDALHGLELN